MSLYHEKNDCMSEKIFNKRGRDRYTPKTTLVDAHWKPCGFEMADTL